MTVTLEFTSVTRATVTVNPWMSNSAIQAKETVNPWTSTSSWTGEPIILNKFFGNTGAASLPRTGQTESYADYDDGYYQKGVAAAGPRFTDNDNGTVTDNQTGLIWLKEGNCFGARNWNDALSACHNLASGSYGLTDGSKAGDWNGESYGSYVRAVRGGQ